MIFPDKVRINRYYLHNYSFWTDIKIIFATVLGRRMEYGGEEIKEAILAKSLKNVERLVLVGRPQFDVEDNFADCLENLREERAFGEIGGLSFCD